MIASSDYVKARDKLIEVRHRFSAFDNISGMITLSDILCSAGFGFLSSGIDWYWVLQLMPTTSESDIQSQYRKFTQLLEPMKNNFPGTKRALDIMQDAFCVLSNPEKRPAYDSKRARSFEAYKCVNSQDSSNIVG